MNTYNTLNYKALKKEFRRIQNQLKDQPGLPGADQKVPEMTPADQEEKRRKALFWSHRPKR